MGTDDASGVPNGVVTTYATPNLAWPEHVGRPASRRELQDRFVGSLLWGALGDALGRPAEGLSAIEMDDEFGPEGVTDLHAWHGWTSGPIGTFTDDTQLTIIVTESLIASGEFVDEGGGRGRRGALLAGLREP